MADPERTEPIQPEDKEPEDNGAEAFKQALKASLQQPESVDLYSGSEDPQPGSAAQEGDYTGTNPNWYEDEVAAVTQSTEDQDRIACYWCQGRLVEIPLQGYLSDFPDTQCAGCGRGFINPSLTHLLLCSQSDCASAYHDRRCAAGQRPARTRAEIPKTKAKCLSCDEEISQDDNGLFTERVMRCSWYECSGYKYFYHSTCIGEIPQHCESCQRYMLDEVRSTDDEPISVPRQFAEQVRSAIWQDGYGVKQDDNLCYAAATATACHCAGTLGITQLECMHLFITTDRCDAICKKDYLEAFARTRTPGEPVSVTLEKMKDQCPDTMKAATTILGEPVFPDNFGEKYYPTLNDAALMQAIRDGKVVMAGESIHWLVIIGFCIDDGRLQVEVFDPGSGGIELITWNASKYRDFYSVG